MTCKTCMEAPGFCSAHQDPIPQLRARIRELEEALIKASKTFPNPELKEQADRIKELEEVMPDFEALREAAFSAFYYIGNDNGLCQMADRIEKVMTKPTSEK